MHRNGAPDSPRETDTRDTSDAIQLDHDYHEDATHQALDLDEPMVQVDTTTSDDQQAAIGKIAGVDEYTREWMEAQLPPLPQPSYINRRASEDDPTIRLQAGLEEDRGDERDAQITTADVNQFMRRRESASIPTALPSAYDDEGNENPNTAPTASNISAVTSGSAVSFSRERISTGAVKHSTRQWFDDIYDTSIGHMQPGYELLVHC